MSQSEPDSKIPEKNIVDLVFYIFFVAMSAGLTTSFFVDNAKKPDSSIRMLALICCAMTIFSTYEVIKEVKKYHKFKKMNNQR